MESRDLTFIETLSQIIQDMDTITGDDKYCKYSGCYTVHLNPSLTCESSKPVVTSEDTDYTCPELEAYTTSPRYIRERKKAELSMYPAFIVGCTYEASPDFEHSLEDISSTRYSLRTIILYY